MAAAAAEETPALSGVPSAETNEGSGDEKEKRFAEPETEAQRSGVETKMEAADAEAGEEKPAASADKATSEAAAAAAAEAEAEATGDSREETPAAEEAEPQRSPEVGNSEAANDSPPKEAKEEPGEDSRCSGMDCEKGKAACEDGDKASGGGGELGDKRRPSVEISSSDGEPLSRMDSEDRWGSGGGGG